MLVYFTFIWSFMLLNLFSPIPGTFFMSSILSNFPFFSLYSIMVFDRLSPIPFRFCNSSLFALLMFIVCFSFSSFPDSSVIIVSSSFVFGMYIFCPSSSSYARFTFLMFAFCVSPSAFSIASAILLPLF